MIMPITNLLTQTLAPDERLQSLVNALHQQFQCGAVVALKLDGEALKPVAAIGLVEEALGRRFITAQHPRFAALTNSQVALRFPVGTPLPDPYDGLLASQPGADLPIHDCMGMRLMFNGNCWGIVTLDSLTPGVFDGDKLLKLERLCSALEANIRLVELENELYSLKKIRLDSPISSPIVTGRNSNIIGKSAAILKIKKELAVVAGSDFPVLLMGETGVGKEVFANFLHQNSRRAHKPMLHINCAALPDNLAESELFGHVKGAFTGATNDRAGRLESAHQATLFLDEVGELSPTIQAKLLRVIQNGEIQRLGSDHPLQIDIRIIAATNRNLKEQIATGSFRADLYHRLSVYPITIPPLRERTEDIPLLTGYFLELNRSRLGIRSLRLSTDAELALLAYPWPGNVRELEHAISRAAIKALSRGAKRHEIITLTADLLDLDLPTPLVIPTKSDEIFELFESTQGQSMKEAVKMFQRSLIIHQLQLQNGSWSATARALGVDPSNLHKLAHKLGIK